VQTLSTLDANALRSTPTYTTNQTDVVAGGSPSLRSLVYIPSHTYTHTQTQPTNFSIAIFMDFLKTNTIYTFFAVSPTHSVAIEMNWLKAASEGSLLFSTQHFRHT
jgi:hypothetical protein